MIEATKRISKNILTEFLALGNIELAYAFESLALS